jgi:hypothetical protein
MSSGLSTEIRVLSLKVKTSTIGCRVGSEELNASNCRVVKEQQITVNMVALRRFEMLITATYMMSYRKKKSLLMCTCVKTTGREIFRTLRSAMNILIIIEIYYK